MKTSQMINRTEQLAAIKLFHAVENIQSNDMMDLSSLVSFGIIPMNTTGEIVKLDRQLAHLVIDTLGINTIDWSTSFHKSWDKVAVAPIEQLVAEQIIHYMGTYGRESVGLNAVTLVPAEKILVDLDGAPALDSFVVVKVLTREELKAEMFNYLKTVKAPHRDSIEYIRTLLPIVGNNVNLNEIKSFENKIIYCNFFNLVPTEAQDFLRFAIFKATKETIIIKNKKTIESLKRFALTSTAEDMFNLANLETLAESFYRFKPLFLAFKANQKLAPKINKIRRYAVKNHKPVSGLTVSNIMNLLAQDNKQAVLDILSKADNRELIKIINFTTSESCLPMNKDNIHIYNIRNGKTFIKEGKNKNHSFYNKIWLQMNCFKILTNNLKNVYEGKKFYIPEGLSYAAPISEKQMMDVLPFGTKIYMPEDAEALCIGGHWVNDKNGRTDLDFHLSSRFNNIGWNSAYRTNNCNILFSGDMTSAPAPYGAVEAFRIEGEVDAPYELSVNLYYNSNYKDTIPYELLFTKDIHDRENFNRHEETMISAIVDPKNAIAPKLSLKVHKGNSEIIGFYYNKTFTIYGGGLGKCIVPDRELTVKAMQAAIDRCESMMTIKDFIILAGGEVIHEIPEDDSSYIDLSPSNLTSTTLFNVVDGLI